VFFFLESSEESFVSWMAAKVGRTEMSSARTSSHLQS
jgi:hypothetical protein